MVVSCYFHGRFMLLSSGFSKFKIVRLHYIIFKALLCMADSCRFHIIFNLYNFQIIIIQYFIFMSVSWRIHVSFMLLSWQIHVIYIPFSLKLPNDHNAIYHIHVSFMADSCHFHATFLADSCHLHTIFPTTFKLNSKNMFEFREHIHVTFMADFMALSMADSGHFHWNFKIRLAWFSISYLCHFHFMLDSWHFLQWVHDWHFLCLAGSCAIIAGAADRANHGWDAWCYWFGGMWLFVCLTWGRGSQTVSQTDIWQTVVEKKTDKTI